MKADLAWYAHSDVDLQSCAMGFHEPHLVGK